MKQKNKSSQIFPNADGSLPDGGRIAFDRFKQLMKDTAISRSIKQRTDRFALKTGRRPRILFMGTIAKTGDHVDRLVPTAFSQWGFDVDIHSIDQPHAQTARAAVENDVHAVIYPFDCSEIAPAAIARIVNTVAVASGKEILSVAWKHTAAGREDSNQGIEFDEVLSIDRDIVSGLSRLLDAFQARKQLDLDLKRCLEGVIAGNRTVIAKAITLIESDRPDHQQVADQLIGYLLPLSGNAMRIAISGVPGAGKSSFIESLGMLLATTGHRVAVLAVDPSSPKTQGSVLGDKTRMKQLSGHPSAFIRPTASGGNLGGIAQKTRESTLLLDAAGFDVVLVETVGVGQSEISVASMVDFFLMLLIAGAGDELQGIKRGILEVSDAVVINKADGDNFQRAREAQKAYESALSIVKPDSPLWKVPVLTCSSLSTRGVAGIWEIISEFRSKMNASGELDKKRRRQSLDWMWARVEEGLKKRFYQRTDIKPRIAELTGAVRKGSISPTEAALELLDLNHMPARNRR